MLGLQLIKLVQLSLVDLIPAFNKEQSLDSRTLANVTRWFLAVKVFCLVTKLILTTDD